MFLNYKGTRINVSPYAVKAYKYSKDNNRDANTCNCIVIHYINQDKPLILEFDNKKKADEFLETMDKLLGAINTNK